MNIGYRFIVKVQQKIDRFDTWRMGTPGIREMIRFKRCTNFKYLNNVRYFLFVFEIQLVKL